MPLKRIESEQIPVGQSLSEAIGAPAMILYGKGRCELRVMAVRLIGATGVQDPAEVESVRMAAMGAPEGYEWTARDAQQVIEAAGTVPAPRYIKIRRVKGQGLVTLRMVFQEGDGVRELRYSRGSARAAIGMRSILKEEGIQVPEGMCLVAPLGLAEDAEGLIAVADLKRGKLRTITEMNAEEPNSAS